MKPGTIAINQDEHVLEHQVEDKQGAIQGAKNETRNDAKEVKAV